MLLNEKLKFIEISLYNDSNFINLYKFNKDILDKYEDFYHFEIEELNYSNNSILYNIFKICKFLNINFKDIKVRQMTQNSRIKTSGEKDADLTNINIGSLNGPLKGINCNCILCKRQFKAIRNNIKICYSKHYCTVIDYFSNEIYEKEIQKWNKVYWEFNEELNQDVFYIEGFCYSCKSHQVSTNNMMTIFNGTNFITNKTREERIKTVEKQKENGTLAISTRNCDGTINEERYENHCKNSKILAKKRIEEGTHNFLNLTKEQIEKRCKNSYNTRIKLGTYETMFGPGECSICHEIKPKRTIECICQECRKKLRNEINEKKKEELCNYINKILNNYNYNIDIRNLENKTGLVIFDNVIHETNNIYNYIKANKYELENSKNIEIILNENNDRYFKLNYQLNKNKIIFKNNGNKDFCLENFKDKSGLIIIGKEIHETKDIYNYIYNHINEFKENSEIEIIENDDNQKHFKLKYQLDRSNIVLKDYDNNNLCLNDFSGKPGLIIINKKVHETADICNYILNNINNFEKDSIIEIIENINSQKYFKLNYKLKENKITFKNYNYKDFCLKNFKNKQGLVIINNKAHETIDIYNYVISHINEFEENSEIEIVENNGNQKYFKLKYQLNESNIKFKLLNDENIIKTSDFDDLENISGVWALWGENKETNEIECLTVGQSIDIGKELKWTLRVLANNRLQDLEKENLGCTGRWNQIQKYYNNFYYVLVTRDIEDFDEREIIESIYAVENNALYWKQSPTQLYNQFLEKLEKYIKEREE